MGTRHFEVLGKLIVRDGSDRLRLGPLQQQAVLAVLLLHANRPVGRTRLIDTVWGEEAPARAVNLIQRHVSGLRRCLVGAGAVAWTDDGYQLTVPENSIDLHLLERATARARKARAEDDLPGAATALHEALKLWRGTPFAGLRGRYLDQQREVLAERRIGLLEDRIEVDLDLGGGADLVAELRDLVNEHPLRERLRLLLMLALYRTGYRAAALEAYQQARRTLRDELGVEPGDALQLLHQRILAGDLDPAGGSAKAVEAGSRDEGWRPAPAQLPHAIPSLIGRASELAQLTALADGGGGDAVVITTIVGMAGVGKTSLAVYWAHQVRDRFPDGQLCVDLRGFGKDGAQLDPAEAVRGFLGALGVPAERIPSDLNAQTALYRSLVAGRRMLIVLDNARDTDQIRPLLPGSPGCLVVVTSRITLSGLVAIDGARHVAVDLLDAGSARDLLADRVGAHRVAAEPSAADAIVECCARLPLALTILGARAATNARLPLAALAEELYEARGQLDPFDYGESTGVRGIFSWSYRQLTPAAARVFRLLSCHPGRDFSVAAVVSLVGGRPPVVRRLLVELAHAHLITEPTGGRYTFHDLLRPYAGELCEMHDTTADRADAVRRLLDHYLHTAYHGDRLLRPHRDDAITLPDVGPGALPERLVDHRSAAVWFRAEMAVLLAAVRYAGATGFDDHAWRLSWSMVSYLDGSGQWHDAVESRAVALEAAERLGALLPRAVSHGCLAEAQVRLGRYDEARHHLEQALERHEQVGDLIGQAHAHRYLAWLLDRQGGFREALQHARQAHALFRRAGRVHGEAQALNAVGWFHGQLGDHEAALDCCGRALTMQRDNGDRSGQAATLDSIGFVLRALGRCAESAAHYDQALRLYREAGHRYNEADTLVALGDTRHAAGDPAAAAVAWRAALTIFDDLRHSDAGPVRDRIHQSGGSDD